MKGAVKLYKEKIGLTIDEFSKDEYGKGHDKYKTVLDLENI